MARRCSVIYGIFGLAFLMALTTPQESSSLVMKMTTRDLTENASQILIGKVVDLSSRWNAEGLMIFTYVTISAKEYIKGASDQKTVTIEVPGGEVGDLALWVSDTPEFKKGETVLLFLRPEFFQIVGWYQGKCTIKEGLIVEKGVSVKEFVSDIRHILENGK